MLNFVNPHRLILARESRNLTIDAVQEHLGYKSIHRVERGMSPLPKKLLGPFAEITGYPERFFMQPGRDMPYPFMQYKKSKHLPRPQNKMLDARINILTLLVKDIIINLKLLKPSLPDCHLGNGVTPSDIAIQMRKLWNIPEGPISNLTTIIEGLGIPVIALDFGTKDIDAYTMLTDCLYPLIYINDSLPLASQQFALACQLGYLLMHLSKPYSYGRDCGMESRTFATAFLRSADPTNRVAQPNLLRRCLATLCKKEMIMTAELPARLHLSDIDLQTYFKEIG